MGTYKKYIDDLEIQKNNLVTALNNKGVEAINAETLNTLVPKVANIEGAKEEQEKTTSASPNGAVIVTPDTGKVLSKVTINTIPTTAQATPTIAVSSGGLITVISKQTEGYVKAGTKMPIRQLEVQDAKTITPSTSSQTAVSAYKFTTGAITVEGDANLTADNIKSGTSIFGVTGSYAGSSPNLQSKSVTYTSNGTNTITPDEGYDGLSSVNVSGGGGSGASAKWDDVTFIDYDGSVLYSYSLAEAQALTGLPELPAHDGLVCQGWNWTLEAIKSINRPVTVGAMYITDDGATRLHIRIATVGRMTVPLYIGQTMSNGVSIDWGDGSTAKTLSGTGNVNTSHTYAEPGDYIISLMPQDGCKLSLGPGISSYCVIGSTRNNGIVYCNMLQEVYVGKNVTSIGNNAFTNCRSLASITIPDGVTSIGNYAFTNCYSLASITIPDGFTSIGSSAFLNCGSLASITIPDGFTSISNEAFSECNSLVSITIPDGVTNIRNYTFNNCYGMRYYDFSACTAIPTLSNTYAFNGIPSDCQMLIPSALYNNWKSATNWVEYASRMVSV